MVIKLDKEKLDMNTLVAQQKKTRDLYLAAAFLALGAKYEGSDRTDPKNMEFIFSPKKVGESTALSGLDAATLDLDFIEAQWVNRSLPINAPDYADAIKRMKSLVHSR